MHDFFSRGFRVAEAKHTAQTTPGKHAAGEARVKAILPAILPSTEDELAPEVVQEILSREKAAEDLFAEPPKRKVYIWLIVILGAILVGAIIGLVDYIVNDRPPEPEPQGYQSPYDWTRTIVDDKGRLHYYDADGNPASLVGIDCSEWDTGTDWAAVAADGIEFAIIRVGYRGSTQGGLYEDKMFRTAYAGATENGILVGLYFFSQATNAREGREEAEFVLQILDGRPLDLPICFDHEGIADPESRAYGLSHEDYAAAARSFCDRLEHAGYTVAIYGNRYAIAYLGESEMADYSIWLAEWDTYVPHAQFDFSIWQFTNDGHVDGMWRRVDHSIFLPNEVPIKTRESRAAAEEAARGDLPYDLVLVPVDRSL